MYVGVREEEANGCGGRSCRERAAQRTDALAARASPGRWAKRGQKGPEPHWRLGESATLKRAQRVAVHRLFVRPRARWRGGAKLALALTMPPVYPSGLCEKTERKREICSPECTPSRTQ